MATLGIVSVAASPVAAQKKLDMLLPGMTINTGQNDFAPIKQMADGLRG